MAGCAGFSKVVMAAALGCIVGKIAAAQATPYIGLVTP
jgi:hypothetical protein